jgi:hypothetical protein
MLLISNYIWEMVLYAEVLQEGLIKELTPGQFIVLDNASFHKSQKTKELIESVGCKVILWRFTLYKLRPAAAPDDQPHWKL